MSTAMLVVAIAMGVAGFALDPAAHHVSIGDDFHVGLRGQGLDSRLVFFNDAAYGPYRGSIVSVSGSVGGGLDPEPARVSSFGDAWGVSYRSFQWPGATLWTLTVSLWIPIGVLAVLPAVRWGRSACRAR
ncbi:MAG: hypothetical protein KDA25_05775 [Phycisphaerales bacterium]|nr:hypothetical protein [Phycisphaerales bacterium]